MMAQCAAMVRFDSAGMPLARPHRCKRKASASGGVLCGYHEWKSQQSHVEAMGAGWCVWCAQPGTRFASSADPRVEITLCDKHGHELMKALEPVRARMRERAKKVGT